MQLPEKFLSINFGAYHGNGELDLPGELVFPFRDHPATEPYWVEQDDGAVVHAGASFRLGQACTFWVPRQDGFEHPVLSRSDFAKASGVVDGDPVGGILILDAIYSTAGLDLPRDRVHGSGGRS